MDDLARLFEHRLLILAGGDGRGAESGDVRRLRNGVGEEPDGNALPLQVVLRVVLREAAQLDFGLHGRVALQTGHGDEVHVVERQFAQFGDLRLDEERRPFGVEAAGQVVERHLDDVLAHLFGVVGVVGERLRVGDHDEDLLELSGVLQLHAAAQRTYIVAEVQFAGRPVSGQDDFSHNSVCRFCISGFCRVDRPDRGMNFFGFLEFGAYVPAKPFPAPDGRCPDRLGKGRDSIRKRQTSFRFFFAGFPAASACGTERPAAVPLLGLRQASDDGFSGR